ncbi:lamin tail domain-containing protein [Patescibacteria group bacterium]|nr:lamin tail domain-containing protein [Patescibacteria group bacterium]
MQAIIIFLLFLTPLSWAIAAEPLSIVVNEIAWMGTETSYNDEWIELYNNSTSIEGWKLISRDGTPEIDLEGEIPSKGFFLLERTDDETVLDIEADLIYKGSLHNQGEYLKLIDNQGNIIDEIDCSEGWFAGDNKTKRTMARKNPLLSGNDSSNWQVSQNPGGTPKTENQSLGVQPLDIEEKVVETTSTPSEISINEILPSAEGPDAENEWIEIFNENNFEVDVSEWKIRDTIGATKTYTISGGTKIKANGFLVFPRPETKITLQNSGDGLELLNPNGEVIDKVNYGKAPLGQSFNRTLSGWVWSTTLTPGKANIITILESIKEKEGKTRPAQTSEIEEGKKAIARIGEALPKASNQLIVFPIALSIAVSSGIIVLFLKKRIKTEEQ